MNMASSASAAGDPSSPPPGNNEIQQDHSSTPYNPMDAATTPSVLGNSVVGDLMQVYESLTQSSTPQTGGTSTDHLQHHHQHQDQYQFHQQHPHASASSSDPHHHHHHHQPVPNHSHPAAPAPPPPPPGTFYQQQPASAPGPYPYYPPAPAPQDPPPPAYPVHQQQQQQYSAAPPPASYHHDAPPAPQHHDMEHPPPPPRTASHQPPYSSSSSVSAQAKSAPVSNSTKGAARNAKRRGSDASAATSTSSKGKGRKKTKTSDDRWSKRFTWPEELHRDFVAAVFDVGLKNATPSAILEQWGDSRPKEITSERIKSHLQKYRIHRAKSKKEFMNSYDSSIQKQQGQEGMAPSLSAGEPAAHAAYSTMTGATNSQDGGSTVASAASVANENAAVSDATSVVSVGSTGQESLALPRLTEVEKQSAMGMAMGHLMGIFFSLKHQLVVQRAEEARQQQTPIPAPKPAPTLESPFNALAPTAATSTRPLATAAAVAAAASVGATIDPSLEVDTTLQHASNPSLDPSIATPAIKTAGAVLAAPSVRTNLEENNLMKREMQHQMAFQNKMRALKQQELNKYRNAEPKHGDDAGNETASIEVQDLTKSENDSKEDDFQGLKTGDGDRARGFSIGASDDWLANMNMDVNDDDLFEFLMN